MHYGFEYKSRKLYVEGVPVSEITTSVGTPCYIYSYAALRRSFNLYVEAFSQIDPLICFSVKANSNLAVLGVFSDLGAGFDIVSEGELLRVIRAGSDTSTVVFSGVGKTEKEMRAAIESDILFFNVESEEELYLLDGIAREMGKRARIALRVNPDIDPDTHPYISTGFEKSKFGIEIGKAKEVYRLAADMGGIRVVGVDAHIGSQIFDLSSFVDSLRKLISLADELNNEGIHIEYLDIGGGLGISYRNEDNPPSRSDYADLITDELEETSYKLILEPGRSLTGNAGILGTSVIFVKEGAAKKFVIVDAAMNDLIRPAFYESYHEIIPVEESYAEGEIVDVVGPICESGDFLAQDRALPRVKRGDLLAVLSAGAYGFVMSSNYNTRPRVPEVMVKGDEFFVVRERETYEDLMKGEIIPEFLK